MTKHKKAKGHANVYAAEAEPWPDQPDKTCIPMVGGRHVFSCKPLPPLALDKEEWETIGLKMGWLKDETK